MAAELTASGVKGTPAPFAHSNVHLIHALSQDIIQRTWTNSKDEWGKTLDIETYYARERHLAEQDFAQNGKLKCWVLVPKSFDPDHPDLDQILSAVETYERPGIVATKDQGLKDVLCVSIASVFCPARYRGHGYATVMMEQLWEEIGKMDNVSFTFLYSDVGPTFYGRMGWTLCRSDEMIIPVSHSIVDQGSHQDKAILEDVTDDNVRDNLARDDILLRKKLIGKLQECADSEKVFVAVTPEMNCIQWLAARSRFLVQHALKLDQHIRALGAKDTRSDSFVLWYHDLLHDELYITRWRLDPTVTSENVARALIRAAQEEAKRWKLSKVVIWDPEPILAYLLQLPIKPRDSSLSCLGFFSAPLNTKDVEWVLNEKYAWC